MHTVSREGQTITFKCRTDLSAIVNWRFDSSTGAPHKTIFGNSGDGKGVLYPDFKERFTVKKEEGGWYNLIISNTSLSDGGNYTCIDNEGFGFGRWANDGLWASAQLVVIGGCCCYTVSYITFVTFVIVISSS